MPIKPRLESHPVNLTHLLLKIILTILSYHQQLYYLMIQKSSLQQLKIVSLSIPLTILLTLWNCQILFFFIWLTPEGTMRRRWFLIQVDMDSAREIHAQYTTNGEYLCIFLTRHPGDTNKSNTFCRWWPDWYKYSCCATTNDIIYGERILIRPSNIPSSLKYIQWSTLLPLTST